MIRGFVFACTSRTEKECFDRSLFGSIKAYGPVVIRVRKGDLLFLYNLNLHRLHGVFRASSDGGFNIQPEAWNGKYPYQVGVEIVGKNVTLDGSYLKSKRLGIKRNKPLFGKKLLNLLDLFILKLSQETLSDHLTLASKQRKSENLVRAVSELKKKIDENPSEIDIEEEIPLLEATTLWDFPKQHYGSTAKGDNMYPGVTPAQLIFNLVWRYTEVGELVVDPMCGSGTTIDVCKEEQRRVIGYDISPSRKDIEVNDSRSIPLGDNTVDMVFVDSPYGDNIKYNEHPDCIGKISSEKESFYDELEKVIRECCRILKPGRVLAWLIGDQWVKKVFTPVGLRLYDRLQDYFETISIVAVSRKGQASNTAAWYNRARRLNFYLHGFKYLFIMRKPLNGKLINEPPRRINWARYDRGNNDHPRL